MDYKKEIYTCVLCHKEHDCFDAKHLCEKSHEQCMAVYVAHYDEEDAVVYSYPMTTIDKTIIDGINADGYYLDIDDKIYIYYSADASESDKRFALELLIDKVVEAVETSKSEASDKLAYYEKVLRRIHSTNIFRKVYRKEK